MHFTCNWVDLRWVQYFKKHVVQVRYQRHEDWSKKQVKKSYLLSLDRQLDRCLLLRFNVKLDRQRQQLDLLRITNSRFLDLKFSPILYICLGFLFSQLQIYIRLILKAVSQGYKDRETYFLYVKLLRFYAIGFCNRVFLDLYC